MTEKAVPKKRTLDSRWPACPSIYEINTWVWLTNLCQRLGKQIDLGSVPQSEWNAIASFNFDAVWFMGVWERSPAGIAIANQNAGLVDDFVRALLDFRPGDNVGSPYCVRRYVVDEHLGGPNGLAVARKELGKRGMRLVLDFVPNHVAPDHPWVSEHPDYFIQGTTEDLRSSPGSYMQIQQAVFACGRDPYFPAWPDVLQLNAFQPGLRRAALETVSDIAAQCDGVRCDMAMLFMNEIFGRTWGSRAGQKPATEYWADLIGAVKKEHSNLLFIAEAYWDLEWQLQHLGFDFCYDKRLYDRLERQNAKSIRDHLLADLAYQRKLLRFIENHDEPRAAAIFPEAKERAAAVTTSTVPGARLFHEGQFEGRKVKLPVFLGRRPDEPINKELQSFYTKLIAAIGNPVFDDGEWNLCDRTGWPGNSAWQNLVAWSWRKDEDRYLIVVNLSDSPAQGHIKLGWRDLAADQWLLTERLSDTRYERSGDEMLSSGLYVSLEPWNYHFFQFCRVSARGNVNAVR